MRWRLSIIFLLFCVCLAAHAQDSAVVIVPTREINSSPSDAVALSADGTLLVSGGRDNLVRLWNPLNGELRAMLSGHTAWVTRVAISPNGQRIASGSQDTTVRLWDSRTGMLIVTLTQHTGSVTGVAFSPDGHLLATTSLDGIIWLGDAETGAEIARLPGFNGPVWSVAFSHDSRRLATGSQDGTIWLWGLYENSIMRLDGHSGAVTALNFSANDTQLISASWDRSARVWDVTNVPPASAVPLLVLPAHDGPVTGAGFTPAGIVTASLDGNARLWDSTTGQLLRVLRGSSVSMSGAAFSGDGTTLITAGTEGVLEVWNMTDLSVQPAVFVPTVAPVDAQPTVDPMQLLPVFTPPPLPTRISPRPTPQSGAPVQTPAPSGGTVISLPTVNLYAGITLFPLDGESWAIDPWEKRVGHLEGTAWFDTSGNVVLGGHSVYPNGRAGIFAALYQLNIGDPIIITVDGEERRYTVVDKHTVRYDDLSVVFPTADPRLTLITCDIPSYDPSTQFYSERLVVVAVPA